MKTLEELNSLSKADLKKYAFEDLALELKGNLSEETLIERIVEKQDELKAQAARELDPGFKSQQGVAEPKPEPVAVTKESKSAGAELEDALEKQIGKGLGFEHDGVAYTISYRGQFISGNLSVPKDIVVRQADVMLNRR